MATLKEQIEALVGQSINDEDEMLVNYSNEVVSIEITSDMVNNGERIIDVTFQCNSNHPVYGRKAVVTLFGTEFLEIDDVQFVR